MQIRETSAHPTKVPYPLIRPGVGGRVTFTCLSRKIFGLDTHFANEATYPCVGPEECAACKCGRQARYQGYLMGVGDKSSVIAIIHLTANAAAVIEKVDGGPRGIVGLKIKLHRQGTEANGEVTATCYGWEPNCEEFPYPEMSELVHSIYRIRKFGSVRRDHR